jgi:hypothetical protein
VTEAVLAPPEGAAPWLGVQATSRLGNWPAALQGYAPDWTAEAPARVRKVPP